MTVLTCEAARLPIDWLPIVTRKSSVPSTDVSSMVESATVLVVTPPPVKVSVVVSAV